MGSGGGGESTTSAQHSPEMRALQQAALPEIKAMLQANPLSTYAAWSPRQIAGSNPAYDQLFNLSNMFAPSAQRGMEMLWGTPQMPTDSVGNNLPMPNMGGTGGGTGQIGVGPDGTTPAPPPQFQPANVQDIVQQQIAAQVQPAVQKVVNQYAALEGPVGGQFWSGGAPMANIVQTTQEGSGFPRVFLDNGQIYTNYGQGWVNG